MFFVLYFKSTQRQAAGMNKPDPNYTELLGEDPVILFHVSASWRFAKPKQAQPARGRPRSQEMAQGGEGGAAHGLTWEPAAKESGGNKSPQILQFNKPQSKFPNPVLGLFVQL